MSDWKIYQDDTAKLFRELGCEVATDCEVAGARGKHLVDVYVGFSKFGLQQHWMVECKYWKRSIPKEKVLALKAIVEEIGADRGILVSEAGFQSGALAVARKTNITLTSLEELRAGARDELLALGLQEVQRRAGRMKDFVLSLWKWKRQEGGFSSGVISSEIDSKLATKIGGIVSVIDSGAQRAFLGTFPVPLRFLEDGNTLVGVNDLEEFVISASKLLDEMDALMVSLKAQVDSASSQGTSV
jgi:hypothetical protein